MRHYIETFTSLNYATFATQLDTTQTWLTGQTMLWEYLCQEGFIPQWIPGPLELICISEGGARAMRAWFLLRGLAPTIRIKTPDIPMPTFIKTVYHVSVFRVARIPFVDKIWAIHPDDIMRREFSLSSNTLGANRIAAALTALAAIRAGFKYIPCDSPLFPARGGIRDDRAHIADNDSYWRTHKCYNIWTCEEEDGVAALSNPHNIVTRSGTRWYVHPRATLLRYLIESRGVGVMRESLDPRVLRVLPRPSLCIFVFDGKDVGAYSTEQWQRHKCGQWQYICSVGWKTAMFESRIGV